MWRVHADLPQVRAKMGQVHAKMPRVRAKRANMQMNPVLARAHPQLINQKSLIHIFLKPIKLDL